LLKALKLGSDPNFILLLLALIELVAVTESINHLNRGFLRNRRHLQC